jgi:uncharacterized membrane-anchored protein
MMRRTLVIIVVALQVLVLAFMAGNREYISLTGTVVHLRTAPVDPRDLFRGDYVRLRYEASLVPYSGDGGKGDRNTLPTGSTVYALLAVGEDGIAQVTGLSTQKPDSGLFMKGKVTDSWRFGTAAKGMVAVEYGIEAYYVEQGKGIEIENRVGTRNSMQTPLEMEVALGRDGTAVIRGHRWSPLGMGLEITESVQRNSGQGRKSAKLRLTMKNTSQKPLALVILPEFCSFTLAPLSPGQNARIPDRPGCAAAVPTDNDVVPLQPDEARSYDIDLADTRWQVLKNDVLTETGTLDWSERFRLIYAPPSREAAAHLKDASLVWHGRLLSRAFHGRGSVD